MASQVPGCNKMNVCPPVVHQPIQFVKQNTITHIVPHVHPVQTTEINNHVFKHQHHFPHTYQSASTVSNQQQQCGSPMPPAPGCC
ncbi:spore coat protein CotH [Bacillus sp. AGMB 02131]|uniref:Spore coat protein CotH n=2 Tax=Peribacillus faecalis TaxID=2772559 RepID=A0A927CVC2_9BACI|nr:spore coat protein CotH [Peribacillus faecalis]